MCRGDGSEQPERAFGDGRQPRPRAPRLLGKRLFGSRQRIVADERTVADRGENVGQQLVRRNRRLQLHRRLRESTRRLFRIRERFDLSAIRSRRTTPARVAASAASRVSSRAIETLSVSSIERRVAGEPLAVLHGRERFRQIAEGPRLESALLERRAGLWQTTAARPRPIARAARGRRDRRRARAPRHRSPVSASRGARASPRGPRRRPAALRRAGFAASREARRRAARGRTARPRGTRSPCREAA